MYVCTLKFKSLKRLLLRKFEISIDFCLENEAKNIYYIGASKILSEFILSRFREVGRPNDRRITGIIANIYEGESINACKYCKQLRQHFRCWYRFSTFLVCMCYSSPVAALFFYFILFCQAHFFMLRGSESIHRKAVAAATVAVMHATVRRVHTGVCAHTFTRYHSIGGFARFSQSIPRNRPRLRLLYKNLSSLGYNILLILE